MTKTTEWRNRITGHGTEAPDQLLAHESNFRIHPGTQQLALGGVLDEIGWLQEVIVNRRTSAEWGADKGVETLLDGHMRVALAISKGEKSIPVKYVDLTPYEERLALASFDAIGRQAGIDAGQLAALVGDDIDPTPFFSESEIEALTRAGQFYAGLDGTDTPDGAFEPAHRTGGERAFPLAIVLTKVELTKWQARKDALGAQDDTAAFVKLLDVTA